MFCSKCGKEIEDNSVFCKYCGKEQSIESDEQADSVTDDIKQDDFSTISYSSALSTNNIRLPKFIQNGRTRLHTRITR